MTKTAPLSPETKSAVQRLVALDLESSSAFYKASGQTDKVYLQTLFHDLGSERGAFARRLQDSVRGLGDTPKPPVGLGSQLPRWWVDLALRSRDSERAILAEVGAVERLVERCYRDTLPRVEGTPLEGIVRSQHDAIRSAHERVRDLHARAQS